MSATFRYVWLTAIRDRLFLVLPLLLLALLAATAVLGRASLVEGEAASVALAAGATRLLVVLGLVIFVCFHVQRLFDSREIEAMLARPVRRGVFVLSYWLAGGSLGAALVLVPVAGLALLQPPSMVGLGWWTASLLLEAFLVVALALTVSLAVGSAVTAVLATLAVYLLGREIGFLLAITGGEFGLAQEQGRLGLGLDVLMQALAVVVPRLDLFAQSEWLLYGPHAGVGGWWFVPQAAVYVALLLAVATFDLRRREF